MSKAYTAATRGCRLMPNHYESMRSLPAKTRLELYDCFMDFVFQLREPDPGLNPVTLAVFTAMRPSLESSVNYFLKQYENGQKGGRPSHNPNETQA